MSISKKVELSSAILAASIIATGCSSSSSSSDQGPLTQLGIFTLDEFDGGAFGSNFAIAAFLDLPGDVAPFLPLLATPTSDRCIIDGELAAEEEEAAALFENTTAISAGDALVLSSPLGTYATLDKRDDDDDEDIFYVPSTMLENIPAELTLDIPGDAFPAFSNVAIPESVTVEDFNFAADNITDATEYTWTPTGAANTSLYMAINFGSALIECEIVDDGSFSFPAEIVAQTGPLTDGNIVDVSVDTEVLMQSGNALLAVTRLKAIQLPE